MPSVIFHLTDNLSSPPSTPPPNNPVVFWWSGGTQVGLHQIPGRAAGHSLHPVDQLARQQREEISILEREPGVFLQRSRVIGQGRANEAGVHVGLKVTTKIDFSSNHTEGHLDKRVNLKMFGSEFYLNINIIIFIFHTDLESEAF